MGAFLRTVTVLARVYSGKENHGEYSRRKGLVIGLDLPYTSEGIMGERMANPWVRKIPWRRKWQPTPVLLPGKSHGQRSLVG